MKSFLLFACFLFLGLNAQASEKPRKPSSTKNVYTCTAVEQGKSSIGTLARKFDKDLEKYDGSISGYHIAVVIGGTRIEGENSRAPTFVSTIAYTIEHSGQEAEDSLAGLKITEEKISDGAFFEVILKDESDCVKISCSKH